MAYDNIVALALEKGLGKDNTEEMKLAFLGKTFRHKTGTSSFKVVDVLMHFDSERDTAEEELLIEFTNQELCGNKLVVCIWDLAGYRSVDTNQQPSELYREKIHVQSYRKVIS